MLKQLSLTAVAALSTAACSDDRAITEPDRTAEAAASAQDATAAGGGAVYAMSNARGGNRVVVFHRAPDGRLSRAGSVATGGTGSGSFEDTSNGLVLGSAQGEAAPNNLIGAHKLLFATNAGSNTISVFRVHGADLELVEVQNSRGEKPVSVTVNRGLLYVLNSGEFNDDLIDDEGKVIPNCTTGRLPSVTGFRVHSSGRLTPIPNSTRRLSGDRFSGCAQVSFDPSGRVLVVTERTAVNPPSANNRVPAGDEGLINSFVVNDDGTLGQHRLIDATGQGPFGFTFNKYGALLTTEQFDGPDGPGRGAAAGYLVNANGTLERTSGSVANGGTDTCWFVVTDDGRYGFTTSFFPDARISSYRVRPNGSLRLLDATANTGKVRKGASDMSLSRDSKYLYQLNSFNGTINAFAVGDDASLEFIQTVQAHGASAMAARIGLAAF